MKLTLIAVCLLFLLSSHTTENSPPYVQADTTGLILPDDLQATLWAESPMLYNPTNMDVDSRGRIWVTEAVNYRDFNNKPDKFLHHDKGDRVMILEDTDGDGVADKSKIFIQDKDLRSPMGIAVLGNRVVVSCAPHLIIYTDENGDDVPDKKDIFLKGFGGYDHDHSLHALLAGPDGRWYFNTGNAGPHIVQDKAGWNLRSGSIYNGGTPYNKTNRPGLVSDDGRVWVGGLALRIGSNGKGLEVVGHNFRNAYELTVDSYGNMWQNDNDDEVMACRTSFLMEGGNAGYFSSDGSRTWRADKRSEQDIPTAHWHQEDPGVIPSGDITGTGSPTGIAINESDLLGKKYRGLLMSADAGRNVIFGYLPKVSGAGFDLKRTDFITSVKESTADYVWHKISDDKSKWFRPSDIAVGTDGAIYIADWYDPVVGGHQMKDTKGYGRIYRITPKSSKLKAPVIDLKTRKGRIEALLSPAVNVRYAGFEALQAEGERAVNDVKKILKSENPYHRARAAWLLANLGKRGVTVAEGLVNDTDDNIRLTAFRALRQNIPAEKLLKHAALLANDPSPAVRREVAIALRDIPFEQAKDIIITLAKNYPGNDRTYLEALGIASDKKEEQLYPLLKAATGNTDPLKWTGQFADIVWRLHPEAAIPEAMQRAGSEMLTGKQRKQALETIPFIKNEQAAQAMIALSQNTLPDVSRQAKWWLDYRKANDWINFNIPDRNNQEISEHGKQMLAMQHKLIQAELSQKERADIASAMASDTTGGRLLISLASEKKLSPEIIAEVGKTIFSNPDQNVRVLAGDYFSRPGGNKTLSIPAILKINGQKETGKALFTAKCASCHRIGKEGAEIGPDLTLISKKFDKTGLLDAIINPSAALAFGFAPWLINTKDGQAIYGFLQADGEAVIIRETSGRNHVINARDIASRKQFTTSIMPDPNVLAISEKDLADISEYLMSITVNN